MDGAGKATTSDGERPLPESGRRDSSLLFSLVSGSAQLMNNLGGQAGLFDVSSNLNQV